MDYARRGSFSHARRPRLTSPDQSGEGRRHRPDYGLLILMSILLVFGAVVVYAIGPGLTSNKDLPENYFSTKQLTAIAIGIVGFVVASSMSLRSLKKLQMPLIISASILAIAVRVIGEEINGAHRWVQVGGFSFQAAELIKLALVLWLADFLTNRRLSGQMGSNNTLKWLGSVVAIIVLVVAGLQSDLGSAAVMMAIIGITALVAGLPAKKLLLVLAGVILLGSIAIISTPYRRDRVATFLNPEADCKTAGYQACQAIITVGSGGIVGKGLGRSVQAYGYLPEPANDSIFAIVSEKFGFVGSSAALVVFWLLLRKIATIARNAPTDYTRLLTVGILTWLSVQMMINVGAMLGLLPLKGITLPFVSYGGTSIIFVMVAMGIVFQVSRYTDLSSVKSHNSSDSGSRTKTVRFQRGLS